MFFNTLPQQKHLKNTQDNLRAPPQSHPVTKLSLAFRKPATHADSRHPARTEGL